MKFDEIWAIEYEKICAFFEEQVNVKAATQGKYYCDGIEINVIQLNEKSVGSLTFPQTRVCIEGENSESLYHKFRLRFLSAGG